MDNATLSAPNSEYHVAVVALWAGAAVLLDAEFRAEEVGPDGPTMSEQAGSPPSFFGFERDMCHGVTEALDLHFSAVGKTSRAL
jgi:hypothetical protein